MPLPAGVQSVTINGGTNGLRRPDGTAFTGTVTVTPSVDRVVSTLYGMIALGSSNATLNASGGFTLGPILATDASGFTPTGWTYRIDEAFTGEPPRSYSISLPASAPTVALPDVTPITAVTGTIVAPSIPNGPASGDLTGTYPAPTVAKVNGVAVTGTPSAGQVPTATSATAAAWTAPPGASTPATTVTTETAYGQASATGSSSNYARQDHTHGTPALTSTAPATTLGIAQATAVGTATTPARADHVHPTAAAGAPTASAVGDTSVTGAATTPAASDHVHAREGFGAVATQTAFGAASANGGAATVARSDHAHGTPTLPAASVSVAGVVQLDGTATDIAPLGTQAAGAVGKAADAGHVHPLTGVLPLAGGTMTGTTNAALANGTAVAEASQVSLDTFDRWRRDASGRQDWGSGVAARDTTFYRSGVSTLATDGAFNVGTTLNVGGTPLWTPAKQGLKGWTYDPVIISANAAAAVAGTFYLSLIELTDTSTLTTLYWDVAVIAAGVVAGQNFVCMVNPSGTIVSSVGVDADIIATGLKATTISVPYTPGQWRVGFLFNATTPPSLARCGAVSGSVNAVNVNITGAAIRGAVNGTALTALPASVTLSANASGSFHWAAVR